MIYTILYGFTIGAILYFISIGLSLTFGTMRVINFAHSLTYTLGVYMLLTFLSLFGGRFIMAGIFAVIMVILVSYLIERFIIRKLYGESVDYTFIATFAVTLIGIDSIKWIWGVQPHPLSDPLGIYMNLGGFTFPFYRVLIVLIAILLFFALEFFFKKTIVGKIVVAALEDEEGVRFLARLCSWQCLGCSGRRLLRTDWCD
jgi:branched-chain amino acid transport system permease protein